MAVSENGALSDAAGLPLSARARERAGGSDGALTLRWPVASLEQQSRARQDVSGESGEEESGRRRPRFLPPSGGGREGEGRGGAAAVNRKLRDHRARRSACRGAHRR